MSCSLCFAPQLALYHGLTLPSYLSLFPWCGVVLLSLLCSSAGSISWSRFAFLSFPFSVARGCLALSALLLSWLCIVASLSVSCCCRFCFRLAGVTLGSLCSPGHSPAPYLAWSAWGLCRCMFRSFCFYLSDFCFYHLSGLYFLALEFSAYFLFYQLFSFLFFVSLTPFY